LAGSPKGNKNIYQSHIVSWTWDNTGESTDALMDSCSQNTLRNERLEHRNYRQERNFIDTEWLSGEMHRWVQKLGAPWALEWGIYVYM
jgi:hypothetical protein